LNRATRLFDGNVTKRAEMNILDFAMQMERDGFEFYSSSAGRVKDSAARRMLTSLANDEKRHEEVLAGIKVEQPKMITGRDFAGIRNVFVELVDSHRGFLNEEEDLSGTLKKGIEVERKSIGLYRELAEQTDKPAEKDIYRKLQGEEEKHERLLALMLEYIDEPAVVLENAEFLFYGHDEAP